MSRLTSAQRSEIFVLHAEGRSQRAIAERVGVSQSTVHGVLRGGEPNTPSTPRIAATAPPTQPQPPRPPVDPVAQLREKVNRIQARMQQLETEYSQLEDRLRDAEIAWATEAGGPHSDMIGRKYNVHIPDSRIPLDPHTGRPQVTTIGGGFR